MMDDNLRKHFISAKRSIPGQSLTNDPNNRAPFEKAPEFTVLRDAIEYLFVKFTDETFYIPTMQKISEGVPIMEMVQLVLFTGFTKGKWNPDLMLLLAEPATYMLMAFAERAGINDYTIYNGEEDEEAAEEVALDNKVEKELIERFKKRRKTQQVPEGIIPVEIERKIEAMPIDSLMAQQGE